MKTTLFLKGLGLISMTTLLFGCPPVDNNATQEPDEDMSMTVDMGGGGEDQGGGGEDQGGGGGTDQGGGGTDQGGGDPDQGGGDLMPPETFEEAREQDREVKAALVCKAAFNCDLLEVEELIDTRIRYASEQECAARIQGVQDASYTQQKAAVDAGRATFDVALAQTCIADIRTELDSPETCDLERIFELFERCDSYVEGSVADGGACVVDADCQGEDGYCEFSGESCAGVCVDFSSGCDQQCGDGTYCDGEMCVPYATLMEECDSVACDEGLFCNYDLGTPVCETLRGVGETCTFDECQLDLYCGFDTQVCTQRKQVGESCVEFDECVEGAYCEEDTSQCTSFDDIDDLVLSVAQGGEPCLDISQSELAICVEGFYCTDVIYDEQTDLEQGTCQAMAKAIGSSCFYDFECAPEFDCNVDQELCVARDDGLIDGAACEFNEECSSGYCNVETETCASPDSCTLAP